MKEQLEQIWKENFNVVPVVQGALGPLTPKLEKWFQEIQSTTSEVSVKNSAVLIMAKILCRTLKLPELEDHIYEAKFHLIF